MKQNRDERWETSGSDAATRGALYDLLSGTRCGSSRRSSRTIARYGNSHVSMARDIVAMDRGSPERNVRDTPGDIPFKASPVEDNFPLRNPRMPGRGRRRKAETKRLNVNETSALVRARNEHGTSTPSERVGYASRHRENARNVSIVSFAPVRGGRLSTVVTVPLSQNRAPR